MKLLEILTELTSSHGPSGDEGDIREKIAELAKPYADEIETDTLGNLNVRKKGSGPKLLFAAHMDSIGFIVTHMEKEGYLRVGKLGGVAPKEAIYTPLRVKKRVRGVLVPVEKADVEKLKLDECCVDIGARDEAEARSMVRVGDTAVYAAPTYQNGGKVFSPYLDNRVSCAVLLAALEEIKDSPNDLYFAFTVQEEVGTRGARTAAWALEPDYGIAVDVTDVDDNPGSARNGTTKLGKGAAIKVMDSSVICYPAVVERLEAVAKERNIPTQRDIMRGGGTDAGPIHVTRTGVLTGGISVPCRYIHTPTECAGLEDAKACVKLVTAFAEAKLERP